MEMEKKQKVVAGQDLDSVIHEHALLFDNLIERIPAKFYVPTHEEKKPWFQGLTKAARAEAKKQTRENINKSRRDRFDPDKPVATTLDLLKQTFGKETLNHIDDRSVTYGELRQRLHRKLEQLRPSCDSENPDRAKEGEDRNVKGGFQGNKRKRDYDTDESKPAPDDLAMKVKKDAEEASKELVFANVKLLDEEIQGKKKRKKVSKYKELERELERAKKLEEVKKKNPEKGEALAKKQSWKAAMNRALGIKVHDDPKLLQKSMKKQKKRQKKNAEKWTERIQTRDQLKADKQQKRSECIAERIEQRKMRKIAKREKKLLRPGFAGRKEGFVNDGPA